MRLVPALLLALAAPALATAQPRMVGGEVDRHGCRPSAGYQWCKKTQRCERPWELAKARGIHNSAKAFKAFCRGR